MYDNHQPHTPLERKTIWKEGEPLPEPTGRIGDGVMPGVKDYAPASETELTQSVSLRVWIAKMLNGMSLVELDVVRASVDLVLASRKSAT
jgi:hypothetical protein